MMFFSIVIPTYNRANFVKTAVKSVLDQTFRNFEIIVVDDGSTDNTPEIMQEIRHPQLRYFRISNNERAFARNYGSSKALGSYITFLDSDDVLLPDYFQNANESLEKYGLPPFLHLAYEVVNDNNQLLFKVDSLENDDIYCLVRGNPLSCTGCFLRADVAKKLRFNENRNLSGSEDWELWFRVLAHYGIKTDSRISARMYNHPSRSVIVAAQERKLVERKELALKYAFSDPVVRERYGDRYNEIDAFGDGYIALHLALLGEQKKSLHYTLRFLRNYPRALFTKRFLVIIKQILVN